MLSLLIIALGLLYINSLRIYENSIIFPTDLIDFNQIFSFEATASFTELPEKQTGLKPLDTVYHIKTEAGIVSDSGLKTVNNQLINQDQTTNLSDSNLAFALPVKKTVYLTFDDGPKNFSPDILSTLNQYGAKATFFMIDGNIRTYPDAARQMVASGHTVASHGVSHRTDVFYQSSQSVISEMEQTRKTIKEVTGEDSILIRTPYGSAPYMTEEYKQAVVTQGLQMWDWNIDSKDWYYRDHRLVDNVIQQVEARKESNAPIVILLHEQQETLAQLPALLQYLTAQQFDLKPLNPGIPPVQF